MGNSSTWGRGVEYWVLCRPLGTRSFIYPYSCMWMMICRWVQKGHCSNTNGHYDFGLGGPTTARWLHAICIYVVLILRLSGLSSKWLQLNGTQATGWPIADILYNSFLMLSWVWGHLLWDIENSPFSFYQYNYINWLFLVYEFRLWLSKICRPGWPTPCTYIWGGL